MSDVIALVQARMGSTRFPGKMIAPLGGRTLLEWVLLRASRSRLVNKVLLATTDLERDDELVRIAESLGIEVYRGSEQDVLERFVLAGKKYNASLIVRICADNPFVDPEEIDRLISFYRNNECDYACNHRALFGSHYSDGFGAEILSFKLMVEIADRAVEKRHREHVTLFLVENPADYVIKAVPAPSGLNKPEMRFDIDTLGDYEYIKSLLHKGVNIKTSAMEIVSLALAG
nr:NTP transferase domain-containing protein [Polynucleobacter sp. MWH-UH2A]